MSDSNEHLVLRKSDGTVELYPSMKRFQELSLRADKMASAIVYWLSEEASDSEYLERFKEALKEYKEFKANK